MGGSAFLLNATGGPGSFLIVNGVNTPVAGVRSWVRLRAAMRVFLKTKGHYYRPSNRVGAFLNEPVEFASVAAATQFALREKLPDAEVALRWDCVNRETGMPVFGKRRERAEPRRLTVEMPRSRRKWQDSAARAGESRFTR